MKSLSDEILLRKDIKTLPLTPPNKTPKHQNNFLRRHESGGFLICLIYGKRQIIYTFTPSNQCATIIIHRTPICDTIVF